MSLLPVLADQLVPFPTGPYGHRDAMVRNRTSWDYQPFVDARRQYVR